MPAHWAEEALAFTVVIIQCIVEYFVIKFVLGDAPALMIWGPIVATLAFEIGRRL